MGEITEKPDSAVETKTTEVPQGTTKEPESVTEPAKADAAKAEEPKEGEKKEGEKTEEKKSPEKKPVAPKAQPFNALSIEYFTLKSSKRKEAPSEEKKEGEKKEDKDVEMADAEKKEDTDVKMAEPEKEEPKAEEKKESYSLLGEMEAHPVDKEVEDLFRRFGEAWVEADVEKVESLFSKKGATWADYPDSEGFFKHADGLKKFWRERLVPALELSFTFYGAERVGNVWTVKFESNMCHANPGGNRNQSHMWIGNVKFAYDERGQWVIQEFKEKRNDNNKPAPQRYGIFRTGPYGAKGGFKGGKGTPNKEDGKGGMKGNMKGGMMKGGFNMPQWGKGKGFPAMGKGFF